MSDFDPGEGWREVPPEDCRAEVQWYGNPAGLDPVKAWVRVPAVPPLPTQPYTVIRVTWADIPHGAPSDWAKLAPGYWHGRLGYFQSDEELQRRITAFEVLAEPVGKFPPHRGPEQAEAWERIAKHPAVQPCYDEDRPLVESVLALLDRYEKLDDHAQEIREDQARETAKAVLDRLREVFNDTRDGRTLNETLAIVADEYEVDS